MSFFDKVGSTVSNIFRAANIGTILFFIFNFMILVCMFSSAGAAGIPVIILIYVISLVLAFSPPGQSVLCLMNGARKMKRQDMRDRVLPIVENIYQTAKDKTPNLPDRINVRIMYDPNPNAFAIGTNTICVTEGMLDMPDELMAGVIAHEMGHLALQHTVIQVLIGGGNLIITIFMFVMQMIQLILAGMTAGLARKGEGVGCFVSILTAMCGAFIWVWTKICIILLMSSSRANEFAADEYAYNIGYGAELAEALDRLTMGTPQTTFLKLLTSSHPEPGDRE